MKVADHQRQRSYGGKVGVRVWVKKRRTRTVSDKPRVSLTKPHVANLASAVVSSASSDSEVDDGDDSSTGGHSLRSSPESSQQRRVVGWDDSLCRPIYEAAGEGSDRGSSHGESDDDHDDAKAEFVAQSEHVIQHFVEGKASKRGDTSVKSLRAYGNRKRIRSSLSAAAAAPLDNSSKDISAGGFRKKARTDDASPVTARTCDTDLSSHPEALSVVEEDAPEKFVTSRDQPGISTPQPYGNSICSMLDSDAKAPTVAASREGNVLVLDMNQSLEQGANKKRLCKLKPRKATSTKTGKATSGSVDTSDAIKQPSSNTSLSAARAFFKHLDSTHQLVVNNYRSPEPRGKRCIRTSRVATVDDPKLRKEYDEYCRSTEESGVPPLPITDYVKHRSFFFRESSMCDGLLDDEP